MLAKCLADEREQHVAQPAKLQLVVLDGCGVVREIGTLRGDVAGLTRDWRPEEGRELYVHVPQAVVYVSHRGPGLVVSEVRDVGAEHEQEPDDRAADGVRLGVEGNRALRRELHVGAAHVNLGPVGHRADRGGEEHLRDHPPQGLVTAVEEPGEERERVPGILPGRELVRHDHRGRSAAAEVTAQLL